MSYMHNLQHSLIYITNVWQEVFYALLAVETKLGADLGLNDDKLRHCKSGLMSDSWRQQRTGGTRTGLQIICIKYQHLVNILTNHLNNKISKNI